MAAKEIVFSSQARQEIAKGLNTLANAVKVTLGPRGRNVVIEKCGAREQAPEHGRPDDEGGRLEDLRRRR
jgi:hypothetical protein